MWEGSLCVARRKAPWLLGLRPAYGTFTFLRARDDALRGLCLGSTSCWDRCNLCVCVSTCLAH
jgi:hypothetical protein